MNKYDYKDLTPFKWFVLENFPFIEADFDAITNYQLYSKVVEYLNNTINAVNEIGNTVEQFTQNFINLKNYVDNYFSNLDVQEEINNKLDEMARTGVLTNLIGNYVDPYIAIQNARIDEQNVNIANQNHEIQNFKSDVNNQLDSTIDYFDNKLNNLTSGTPLVASSVSEMTNTNRIYVNITDGKWYYYDEDNSTWTIGGTYQSAGIPKKFITEPYFKSTKRIGKNLFDKQNVFAGYIGSNGTIHENETSESGLNNYSDFIEVDTTISNFIHNEGRCNLIFYDNSKTYISGTSILNSGTSTEFPENTKYIRCSTLTNQLDLLQLEYGKRFSGYEEFLYSVDELSSEKDLLFDNNNQLKPQNIKGYKVLNDNLFDPYDLIDGIVTISDGWVQATGSISNPKSTGFIEIEPEESYYLGSAYKNVVFYDENKEFISGSQSGDVIVTTPATAKYLRMTFDNTRINQVCCVKSTTKNFINFEYTFEHLKETTIDQTTLYSPFKKDYINYEDILNAMTVNSRIVKSQDEFGNNCIGLNPENDNNTGAAIVLNYFVETAKKCCEVEFDCKGKYGTNNFFRVVYYDKDNVEITSIPQNGREFNILNQTWEHKKVRFLIPMFAKTFKIMIFARPGSALFVKNLSINCIDRALCTDNSNLKFFAHQGQPLFAPENTIPSFEYAFKGGYENCVINVNWTSDNVIVCLHDDTIDRTSNGSGNIHEMTYQQALNFDFGSWFNTAYEGTKLPTLEEVLMLFARNGVKPTIRWNTGLSASNRDQIFTLLNKLGLEDNVTILSFDIDTLLELKQIKPNYKYSYCGYGTLNETLINKLKQLGDDVYFDRETGTLTQEEVSICHQNGIKVSGWMVNDKVWMYRFIDWGIDAIKTDIFCLQNCNI